MIADLIINRKNFYCININALCLILILIFFCIDCSYATEEVNNNSLGRVKLQAVLTPPYIIGPGDQLLVVDRTLRDVTGQIEQYNITISADGYISIPLPDGKQENILAAGYTLDELSNEVREAFGKTLKNPLVYVQISKYRPINVYIGGEIVKPGVYKIETASTSEKGGSTSAINTFGLSITQAIQLAGGLKPRANIRKIIITRGANLEKKIIDLTSLLKGEDISQDINLQPGDAIYIKAADIVEDQAQYNVALLGKLAYQDVPISVVGEVNSGGNFTLPNDATLLDAIGRAGGLKVTGSLKKVRLSRFDDNGVYRTHNINVHDLIYKGISFDQIALRPNDTIELEASRGKEIRHFFRDASQNSLATVVGAFAGGLSGFVVQDNMFNRVTRAAKGNSLSLPSGGGNSNNAITIFGKRITDKNE